MPSTGNLPLLSGGEVSLRCRAPYAAFIGKERFPILLKAAPRSVCDCWAVIGARYFLTIGFVIWQCSPWRSMLCAQGTACNLQRPWFGAGSALPEGLSFARINGSHRPQILRGSLSSNFDYHFLIPRFESLKEGLSRPPRAARGPVYGRTFFVSLRTFFLV